MSFGACRSLPRVRSPRTISAPGSCRRPPRRRDVPRGTISEPRTTAAVLLASFPLLRNMSAVLLASFALPRKKSAVLLASFGLLRKMSADIFASFPLPRKMPDLPRKMSAVPLASFGLLRRMSADIFASFPLLRKMPAVPLASFPLPRKMPELLLASFPDGSLPLSTPHPRAPVVRRTRIDGIRVAGDAPKWYRRGAEQRWTSRGHSTWR